MFFAEDFVYLMIITTWIFGKTLITMRKAFLWGVLALAALVSCSKGGNDPRLVIITFDGLRWQELYGGADEALVNDSRFVKNVNALKENRARTMYQPYLRGLWRTISTIVTMAAARQMPSATTITIPMTMYSFNISLSGGEHLFSLTISRFFPNYTLPRMIHIFIIYLRFYYNAWFRHRKRTFPFFGKCPYMSVSVQRTN